MHFGYFRKTSSGGSKKPRVHKSQMLKPAVLEGAWTIDENSFREEEKKYYVVIVVVVLPILKCIFSRG